MKEALEALKRTLGKEIKTVAEKGSMTPAELEAVTKAMCLYEMIDERLMLEGGYDTFRSADNYSQRYYRDNSMAGMNSMNSYYMPDQMSYNSYARGRSPVTGRYVSRDYESGRSGHSIKDRMIDQLERMMDQAGSEYERQEILREIEKMRSE